jgi:hypothetical protein
MKKLLTRVVLVVLVLLLAIQLIPVERTNPPVKLEIPAPAEAHALLERSCYDCHSNRTRWPWYSYVAPASWFVIRHVRDGRKDLNMTEWPLMDTEAQLFFLGEMKKQLEERNMPLESYLLLHWGARLGDAERDALLAWIDEEIVLLSEPAWP